MGKIGIIVFLLCLISCKKNKEDEPITEPIPCKNLSMTGDLSRLTGKWKWLGTDVGHVYSFDCSYDPPSYIYPTDVNFTFKLEITNNGTLKVIKNDTLSDVLYLTGFKYITIATNSNVLNADLTYNCSDKEIYMSNFPSHDTLLISLPQVSFNNANQTQLTSMHWFVRN